MRDYQEEYSSSKIYDLPLGVETYSSLRVTEFLGAPYLRVHLRGALLYDFMTSGDFWAFLDAAIIIKHLFSFPAPKGQDFYHLPVNDFLLTSYLISYLLVR